MSDLNLTDLLSARRDRYASKQGEFVLSGEFITLPDADTVWTFLRECKGKTFRVIYQCQDETVRDMIGRQGVYESEQDGKVQNVGHAMTNPDSLTLSFWTYAHGKKVNTGSGAGYRTLRAAGILAIRIDGVDIITNEGQRIIREFLCIA